MPIQILNAPLQNQIAAGEVLERPASALKELLENSLDAGAKNIFVSLENGGRRIIIQDDGCGIAANELKLALTRHATSKISKIEDLNNLHTFGFRGEALPSIASVSKLTIASTQKGQENASEMRVAFGKIQETVPSALTTGTKIEISDLFANVPARLKFMKTPSTEIKRCQDIFFRTCLAHLECDFELEIDDKPYRRFFAGQDLKTRLESLWPPQITEKLLYVDYKAGSLQISGFVGSPETAQTRSERILFYINNRPIHNIQLLQALRLGYKGRILTKEYPQAVLFITIPPEMVDVNASPTKNEVRFQDERGLFSFILHALEKPLTNSLHFSPIPSDLPTAASFEQSNRNEELLLPLSETNKEKFASTANGAKLFSSSNWNFQSVREPQTDWNAPENQEADKTYYPKQDISQTSVTPQQTESPYVFAEETLPQTKETVRTKPLPAPLKMPGGLTYLGQIGNTYLIFTYNDRLLLIDQHAAHERILFHRFRNQEKPSRNRLAIPLEITLHAGHLDRLEEIWEKLLLLGFMLERPDPQILHITAIPSLLNGVRAKEFVESVLQGKEITLDGMWAMLACRSAIKAGDRLAANDIQHLLEQWLACPQKEFCPHGRPSVLDFGCNELEKMFKRK